MFASAIIERYTLSYILLSHEVGLTELKDRENGIKKEEDDVTFRWVDKSSLDTTTNDR